MSCAEPCVRGLSGITLSFFSSPHSANLDSYDRYGHNYCLAMADIDYFKHYNDTYGHLEGDKILKQVAQLLERGTRGSDRVYRFGGEEFLLVFCEQSLEQSRVACERLRVDLEQRELTHAQHPLGRVTITFGLAVLEGSTPEALQTALNQADEALYVGKNEGRNRVVLASSSPLPG